MSDFVDHVVEPKLTGLVTVRLSGEFFSTQRTVHLSNDILFVGDLQNVEHLIGLEQAVIRRSGKTISICPKAKSLAATLYLDYDEQAEKWETMLIAASKHTQKVHRIRERSQSRFNTPAASPTRRSRCQTPKRGSMTPRRGLEEADKSSQLHSQITRAMEVANQRHPASASRDLRQGDRPTTPRGRSDQQVQPGQEQESDQLDEAERDMLYKQLGQVMAAVDGAKRDRDQMRKERDAMRVQLMAATLSTDTAKAHQENAEQAKLHRADQLNAVHDKVNIVEVQWLAIESKLASAVALNPDGHRLRPECDRMREMHTYLSAAKFAATPYEDENHGDQTAIVAPTSMQNFSQQRGMQNFSQQRGSRTKVQEEITDWNARQWLGA